MDWAKTTVQWNKKHLSLAIWCNLYQRTYSMSQWGEATMKTMGKRVTLMCDNITTTKQSTTEQYAYFIENTRSCLVNLAELLMNHSGQPCLPNLNICQLCLPVWPYGSIPHWPVWRPMACYYEGLVFLHQQTQSNWDRLGYKLGIQLSPWDWTDIWFHEFMIIISSSPFKVNFLWNMHNKQWSLMIFWTHNRHPISHPTRWDMGCLLVSAKF